jgi:hypothetical protein
MCKNKLKKTAYSLFYLVKLKCVLTHFCIYYDSKICKNDTITRQFQLQYRAASYTHGYEHSETSS